MIGAAEVITIVAGIAAAVGGVAFILYRHQPRELGAGDSAGADPWQVVRNAFASGRETLSQRIQQVWAHASSVESGLSDLEEVLLTADVGVSTTRHLLEKVRSRAGQLRDPDSLRRALREEIRALLPEAADVVAQSSPLVILVAGVNGVGKTTSIGKLACYHVRQGRKVLLVAADTFRAAASEQLQFWATRVGADCVRHQGSADPSAVAFDGINAAIARGVDLVIIDTAGRLHVKSNLIEELKKVVRVIGRQLPGAPHEVLLVVDATTGQNAVNQARVFRDALPLTGIILTKLDGTAKGGAILAAASVLGVPIRFIGYGEGVDAFAPFDPDAFVDALLEPSMGGAAVLAT